AAPPHADAVQQRNPPHGVLQQPARDETVGWVDDPLRQREVEAADPLDLPAQRDVLVLKRVRPAHVLAFQQQEELLVDACAVDVREPVRDPSLQPAPSRGTGSRGNASTVASALARSVPSGRTTRSMFPVATPSAYGSTPAASGALSTRITS